MFTGARIGPGQSKELRILSWSPTQVAGVTCFLRCIRVGLDGKPCSQDSNQHCDMGWGCWHRNSGPMDRMLLFQNSVVKLI